MRNQAELDGIMQMAAKGNIALYDVPEATYHAFPAMSASGMKEFRKAPGYWKWMRENPSPDTSARLEGRLVHMALGEPGRFAAEVVRVDGSRNATAVKADIEFYRSQGKTVCKTEQAEEALAIAAYCRSHPLVSQILKAGKSEVTLLWKDPESGAQCKARIDWLTPNGVLCDWKSFGPVWNENEIERQIRSMNYHFQADFYLQGYRAVFAKEPQAFYNIMIRNELPYDVAVREIATQSLEEARPYIGDILKRFSVCQQNDVWPMTPPEVQTIVVKPFWD